MQRERVAKSDARQRAAEIRADGEAQLATIFQAEEQLKQLTAGTTDSDIEPKPNTVDAEGTQLLQESDPGPTGVLAWWQRLWGG